MRKENMTYYFSVEGETEKWYLDWLQNCINECDEAKYKVKLDSKIEKDSLVRAKSMTILGKTEITHVFDRESEDELHTKQFMTTLDRMKEAEKLGKNIKYKLGYSNFTFELWMRSYIKRIATEQKQIADSIYLRSIMLIMNILRIWTNINKKIILNVF